MLIVNFGQVVDLEHGTSFTSQFTVLLHDGQRILVRTDEATIEQLTAIAGGLVPEAEELPDGGNSHPQDDWERQVRLRELGLQHPPHLQAVPDIPPEPENDEFGGDYDPGEEAEVPDGAVMGAMAERRVATHAAPGGLGTPGGARLVGTGGVEFKHNTSSGLPPRQAAPQPRRPMVDGDGYLVPPRGRTVPKDEMGYPVVQQTGAARSIVGDDDDDGQQI